MHIVLIADAFPPMRSSGAVQLRDLTLEFVAQGHEISVLIPDADMHSEYNIESWHGAQVIRLRSPKSKDVGYIRRTLAEWVMPYSMYKNLLKSKLATEKWDGVVWYSPTIFLGPLAKKLKASSNCKSYLIIRDIFPEWAVDMGLMGKGLPYLFFKWIANKQYLAADIIGIQTPGNQIYFNDLLQKIPTKKVEVLQNWLAEPILKKCSIDVSQTPLAGRKIFVYAGNMGVAQGVLRFLPLIEVLKDRTDIGFLFVGRGSDALQLNKAVEQYKLTNMLVYDEIDPEEIPGLYAQCHVGMVALAAEHKSHNIPGKFVSYMQSGLPAFALINEGNDLVDFIRENKLGVAFSTSELAVMIKKVEEILFIVSTDNLLQKRCLKVAQENFSSSCAVRQIVNALTM